MKAKIYAQEFKRIIENTKRFVGDGSNQELMQWIYLQINADKKEIKATATDGHRASVEYALLKEADESFTCYIRPNIPKILKLDEYAELEVNNNRLYAQVGESIIGYVQPEGKYFNIDKVLEKCFENKKTITVGVNSKYLKEALESINFRDHSKPIAKIDVYGPKDAIIIRSGRIGEERENIKLILPVALCE